MLKLVHFLWHNYQIANLFDDPDPQHCFYMSQSRLYETASHCCEGSGSVGQTQRRLLLPAEEPHHGHDSLQDQAQSGQILKKECILFFLSLQEKKLARHSIPIYGTYITYIRR
jgi:hypothetical protein